MTDDRKQEHPCLLAVVGLLSSVALEMSNAKWKMSSLSCSALSQPLPAMVSGVAGLNCDESAAAGGRDLVMSNQFPLHDRAVLS